MIMTLDIESYFSKQDLLEKNVDLALKKLLTKEKSNIDD
jgi:hypothetical protein